MKEPHDYMDRVLELASQSAATTGGPFGAIVVRDGLIVGEGTNRVTSDNDPTAHAEIVAIRDACKQLGTFSLEGSAIFASCAPCPMCLAAIHWSRIDTLYYGAEHQLADEAGFDDGKLRSWMKEYLASTVSQDQFGDVRIIRIASENAGDPFNVWNSNPGRVPY